MGAEKFVERIREIQKEAKVGTRESTSRHEEICQQEEIGRRGI